VIFVVAVIDLTGAPVPRQSAASVAALAAAYGVRFVELDGRDAGAVRDAVAAAREQNGPTCVAAVLNA
jgi:TPP-dependent pyruvate/acetoin dehydrogenase alpha subunit